MAEIPSSLTTPGATLLHVIAEANAQLIAAAPDLLIALHRMLDCHQAAMDAAQSSAVKFTPRSCECGACDQARAAIARAEGR